MYYCLYCCCVVAVVLLLLYYCLYCSCIIIKLLYCCCIIVVFLLYYCCIFVVILLYCCCIVVVLLLYCVLYLFYVIIVILGKESLGVSCLIVDYGIWEFYFYAYINIAEEKCDNVNKHLKSENRCYLKLVISLSTEVISRKRLSHIK